MAFAQGSRASISYMTEVTFGVTPGAPVMIEQRNTGSTLNMSKETFTSAEIRSDRQIAYSRHGNKQVGGDINFELAYGNLDDILESIMFSTWAASAGTASGATSNATGYAIGSTSITLASAGTGTIVAGDVITFAGDTTPYVVVSGSADVSAGGTVVIESPGLTVALATSATSITVGASESLKAGVTQKSLVIERAFADVAQYLVYNGCVANALSLNITAGQVVTGSVGFVGSKMTASGTVLDASITAAPTGDPFTAFEGTLFEAGTAIAIITGMTLSLDNGVEANFVVGSDETPQLSYGRSNLTGTVTAFFEDLVQLNKFINETESSLKMTLTDSANKVLQISIPRLKYNGGDIPVSGEQSLQINMPFQALYNVADLSNLILIRTP